MIASSKSLLTYRDTHTHTHTKQIFIIAKYLGKIEFAKIKISRFL
jgi:hypothetical protein